jgi:large subunit ribosomal protein L11
MFIDKDNLTIVKRKRKKSGKEEPKVLATLRLIVEAGEAKPVAPIAPIMGLYQLNTIEFCKRFNEMTKEYELGLPLPTVVRKKSDGKVEIELKSPLIVFLLWVMMEEEEKDEISIEELYDIIKIRKRFDKKANEKGIAIQLLSLLENADIEDEIGV